MRTGILVISAVALVCGFARFAVAEEVTWRTGIGQIVQARCAGCHGAAAKEYSGWNLGDKKDARAWTRTRRS